jgi:NADH-quinone oxidoreductase subunit J
MDSLFFWLFAIGMIVSGVGVVINRSPVGAALCLVLTIVHLAALYVTLGAFFLFAVQILVYAGAVMVLFLFIIMLLDLKEPQKKPFRLTTFILGLSLALVFSALVAKVISTLPAGSRTLAELAPLPANDIVEIGRLLFTKYVLPFEITSVLLLVATVGVILLSKREKVK